MPLRESLKQSQQNKKYSVTPLKERLNTDNTDMSQLISLKDPNTSVFKPQQKYPHNQNNKQIPQSLYKYIINKQKNSQQKENIDQNNNNNSINNMFKLQKTPNSIQQQMHYNNETQKPKTPQNFDKKKQQYLINMRQLKKNFKQKQFTKIFGNDAFRITSYQDEGFLQKDSFEGNNHIDIQRNYNNSNSNYTEEDFSDNEYNFNNIESKNKVESSDLDSIEVNNDNFQRYKYQQNSLKIRQRNNTAHHNPGQQGCYNDILNITRTQQKNNQIHSNNIPLNTSQIQFKSSNNNNNNNSNNNAQEASPWSFREDSKTFDNIDIKIQQIHQNIEQKTNKIEQIPQFYNIQSYVNDLNNQNLIQEDPNYNSIQQLDTIQNEKPISQHQNRRNQQKSPLVNQFFQNFNHKSRDSSAFRKQQDAQQSQANNNSKVLVLPPKSPMQQSHTCLSRANMIKSRVRSSTFNNGQNRPNQRTLKQYHSHFTQLDLSSNNLLENNKIVLNTQKHKESFDFLHQYPQQQQKQQQQEQSFMESSTNINSKNGKKVSKKAFLQKLLKKSSQQSQNFVRHKTPQPRSTQYFKKPQQQNKLILGNNSKLSLLEESKFIKDENITSQNE